MTKFNDLTLKSKITNQSEVSHDNEQEDGNKALSPKMCDNHFSQTI